MWGLQVTQTTSLRPSSPEVLRIQIGGPQIIYWTTISPQENGFIGSQADPCLFTHIFKSGHITLSITAEDLIVSPFRSSCPTKVIAVLRKKYISKDLGFPERNLVWTIAKLSDGSLYVAQPNLIRKILLSNGLLLPNGNPDPLPWRSNSDELSESQPLSKSEFQIFLACVEDLRYLLECFQSDLGFDTLAFPARTMLLKTYHKPQDINFRFTFHNTTKNLRLRLWRQERA